MPVPLTVFLGRFPDGIVDCPSTAPRPTVLGEVVRVAGGVIADPPRWSVLVCADEFLPGEPARPVTADRDAVGPDAVADRVRAARQDDIRLGRMPVAVLVAEGEDQSRHEADAA